MSADRQGWFADIDPEQADSQWPWQPCLQLDGVCYSFEVWFRTEQECVDYIRSEIIGQGLLGEEKTTEHAIMMSGGGMHIRNTYPQIERIYPLAEWIGHQQRDGGRVFRRRVIVVEDWTELSRPAEPVGEDEECE